MPPLVFGLLCTMIYTFIGCGCHECKKLENKL